MKKEILIVGCKLVGRVTVAIIESAALAGGIYVAGTIIGNHFSVRCLRKSAKIACDSNLKVGEIVEIYLTDVGIPFLMGEHTTSVSMYAVRDIKTNGKYKMKYVGSRCYTVEEVKDVLDL